MLQSEVFLVGRNAKENPLFSVAWYYPNTYAVGMSGLGYQLVWSLFERHPEVIVRRGFTDTEEPGAAESELQGFTVSWELDLINILNQLQKNGISPLAADRGDGEPFVFGGGPVLTANPEPFADFFDLILVGDAETMVPAFIEKWKEIRSIESRKERLLRLSEVPGIYVPSLYQIEYEQGGPIKSIRTISDGVPEKVEKQIFASPPDYAAHTLILSNDTAWGDRFLIEVVRSCPQECRFCLASFLTRPFRAASVDTLMQKIESALPYTQKIGLLGPSVTEHPAFEDLAQRLLSKGNIDISVASIRADSLSQSILEMIHKLGQRSVTIAIESGSERLRAIMKKNLSEEQ
ncbi:MAG TPA: radical SAM protein, partial [Chroococcales cyanobacterium]